MSLLLFDLFKFETVTQSAKYHCILDWNNFKKTFLGPAEHRNPKFKARPHQKN